MTPRCQERFFVNDDDDKTDYFTHAHGVMNHGYLGRDILCVQLDCYVHTEYQLNKPY